jgi:hypothetical protein
VLRNIAIYVVPPALGAVPFLQGTSRTPTTTAWGAKTEDFNDDLNFKIGDLLSRPLSLAPRAPAATRARWCLRAARPSLACIRCCLRARYAHAPAAACAPVSAPVPRAPVAACAPVSAPVPRARPFMCLNLWHLLPLARPLRTRARCAHAPVAPTLPLLPARPFPRPFRARAR